MKRLGIAASFVLVFGVAFASPVLAAAPSNDTYAGRTVVTALPFSDQIDTTEATTDADDVEAVSCAPVTADASVWYELTATSDGRIEVMTKASSYLVGLVVVTGSPGSFAPVACDVTGLMFDTSAKVTYSILAFDLQTGDGVNGGILDITIQEVVPPPPPPIVDLTIDPVGRFDAKTGSATITGRVSCAGIADIGSIDVQLRQVVGRFVISGRGSVSFFGCDGSTKSWTAIVVADNGLFKGGSAESAADVFALGPGGIGKDAEQLNVNLRR